MRLLAITAVLAALPMAAAQAETTILPGYWQSDNHLSFLLEQDSSSKKCITPEQVDNYLAGPVTKHYSCVYDRRHVADGQVHLKGQCTDKNGIKIDVDITGTYTRTSFDLNAQLSGNMLGLPMVGAASTRARRISEMCPDPAAGR
jgi:hypothetical protein